MWCQWKSIWQPVGPRAVWLPCTLRAGQEAPSELTGLGFESTPVSPRCGSWASSIYVGGGFIDFQKVLPGPTVCELLEGCLFIHPTPHMFSEWVLRAWHQTSCWGDWVSGLFQLSCSPHRQPGVSICQMVK